MPADNSCIVQVRNLSLTGKGALGAEMAAMAPRQKERMEAMIKELNQRTGTERM